MVPTRFGGRPRLWSRFCRARSQRICRSSNPRNSSWSSTSKPPKRSASTAWPLAGLRVGFVGMQPRDAATLCEFPSSGWSRFSAASCFRCQRSADHLSDEDEDATKKEYNHDDKQVVRDYLPKVDFDAASEIEANSNHNCTA